MTDTDKAIEDFTWVMEQWKKTCPKRIKYMERFLIEHEETIRAALKSQQKPCEAVGKEYCWTHDRYGEECQKALTAHDEQGETK